MEEISIDEFEKRANDLVEKWKEKDLEVREMDTALPVVFIPYILMTIYYSWGIHEKWLKHKDEKDVIKNVDLWIDESIDRIFQLALRGKINKEDCRNDMKGVVCTLIKKVGPKDPPLAPDILSNKLFDVLKKYYRKAGSRERKLVDYIVRSEQTRLLHEFM